MMASVCDTLERADTEGTRITRREHPLGKHNSIGNGCGLKYVAGVCGKMNHSTQYWMHDHVQLLVIITLVCVRDVCSCVLRPIGAQVCGHPSLSVAMPHGGAEVMLLVVSL